MNLVNLKNPSLKIRVKSDEELYGRCSGRDVTENNYITFASPEEALQTIEAEEEALNYDSDDDDALIMDLSQSGGTV